VPEYLAPGVYVEEVSFRAKSIEGVPTSTTGFAGLTRYGPVVYRLDGTPGPSTTEPRLITSFTEFERVYGGLGTLSVGPNGEDERPTYLAHAARAFFMNGGKRLYVSRVFTPRDAAADPGVASEAVALPGGNQTATWRARWPGAAGEVFVTTRVVRSKNVAFEDERFDAVQARLAREGAVVEILFPVPEKPPVGNEPLDAATLAVVAVGPDGRQTFLRNGNPVNVDPGAVIQLVELLVLVRVDEEREDAYEALGAHPAQRRYIGTILGLEHPEDDDAVVALQFDSVAGGADGPIDLMVGLQSAGSVRLQNGNDGLMPNPDDLLGRPADLDDATVKATGLEALGEIDDIAIVALPDGGTYTAQDAETQCVAAADRLIRHAQQERYRIAIVDAPEGSSITEVRRFRGQFDSKYAALYHPWIEILNPLERLAQGAPPSRLLLPPSGFVAGIYARSDIERGVYKAPANEVVFGLTQFEANINKGRQDVLNPEGINALRFFEGRGNRVWGARTMSSDPEWKYVNVRRLFIYLEHSIDKATQWAVFEPNNPRLWSNIQRTVEDFLLVQWRDGALLGANPDEAFFVRCDRTTMTQNDLDNGRLIVLIGVAPTRPAEFVIFRIGQFTADARTS
jgi:phage tail sheath protein FI